MNNKSLIVGVLGPKGSYTEQAALEYFGECSIKDDYLSPENVIEAVSKLVIDYGVVPVENSIQGGVSSVFDTLLINRVNIIGQLIVPIHHVLACHPKARKFSRIISHQQALNQCKNYLRMEYPYCVLEPAASTSHAAQKVIKEGFTDALVVCSEHAAKVYGLKILASDISTTNNNETRFFIIGNCMTEPTGDDLTSLVFGLKDRPGVLFDTLKVFKDHGVNLTRIGSRPTKKKLGDYLFFIDFEGHKKDKVVGKVIEALEQCTTFIKILGSYPRLIKKFNSQDQVGVKQ